ncbi:hypothetical protein BGX34_003559 [Mortierella sp. NVP85]|nr:hypothetical protein BGX34_003559 [Mortierella sp. NVP85]
MGKKAADNLFKAGVIVPVVLLHGQGLKVNVHTIAFYSEAFYKVSDLGTFKLVSSPHEFGMLLSIGPLYSAQAIAAKSYNTIKSGARVITDERWPRGTFDVNGITVDPFSVKKADCTVVC